MDLFSFFCGPGGLDEGFRLANHKTLAATDVDAAALLTFKKNHSDALVFPSNLQTASIAGIVSRCLAVQRTSELLGVVGGPPCQSFSDSNVHQTDDDPRHDLPLKYAEILKALNRAAGVSFFVFENVPGLLRKRHAKRYSDFKDRFKSAGFEVFECVLDAQHYGVAQHRPRVIIVGLNTKIHKGAKWSAPTKARTRKTVFDAIGKLPEPIAFRRGLTRDDIPFHPNHWCMAPKSRKFTTADLRPGQAFGRSFRTLEWDQPSWTVAYGHREVHVHPNGKRRLSVYEAMLLQSFPKHYELVGTLSSQIKQVSDAVPPLLAKAIAESIALALKR